MEKYEEFCWDSDEPLFSGEDLKHGQMFSLDPEYGKLGVSMMEAKGLMKSFAAEALFNKVMKKFDDENTGKVCTVFDANF